ncbi:MAG: hypothetical protein IKQ31_03970 [Clostridia bacterium]|nr:hypothetical protein [Clostridia bacterium]
MEEIWGKFTNSALYADVIKNRLIHTVLLVGEDSFAVEKFSLNLVLTIMCEGEKKPCLNCTACKKVLHNNNVDVCCFPRDSKQMNVKEIEEFEDLVYSAPYEANQHVFVLKNANLIDKNTQNKLLKILEEPPANTYIILQASEEYNILPTIKSRARIVRVPKMDDNEIADVLKETINDNLAITTALSYSDSNCAKALRFATDENFLMLVHIMEDLCKNFNHSSQMLNYASKLYTFASHFDDILEIFLNIVERAIRYLSGSNSQDELAKAIVMQYSVNALIEFNRECLKFEERFKRNANANGLIDSFLFMILEVRHKWPITL